MLTGARKVGPAAEGRIRRAIDELGYRPNRSARALKTGRSDVVGLVLSDVTNPYFSEFALEIEYAAADRGRAVMLVNANGRVENELQLIHDLLERGVDGLIIGSAFGPGTGVDAREVRSPIVWIDAAAEHEGHLTIGPTMADDAETAVRHLIDVHGSRDIALALGEQLWDVDQRRLGWERALEAARLPLGAVVRRSWSRAGGYRCGVELLTLDPRPDAVFAASDLIAVGFMRAVHDAGLRVPDDVAVVSFDGIQETEYSIPRLTTLRQPIRQMARAAVDAVLGIVVPESSRLQFAGELMVRESCGCNR